MVRRMVVNLFGGPGAGKTTMSTGVFSLLKLNGVNCELVTEFAKTLTWQEDNNGLEDQIYILGNQYHNMFVLKEKVDVIITDSPLLLNLLYKEVSESQSKLTLELFNGFDNFNYYVRRKKKYQQEGRIQTEEESIVIDNNCKKMLNRNKIKYKQINGDYSGINEIVSAILNIRNEQNILKIINI